MKTTSVLTWEKYWKNKIIIKSVNKNYWFNDLFKKELKNFSFKDFLEIGGYPGYFAIYFKKYWNSDVSLLDYVVDRDQIEKLLEFNELNTNDISVIESDLFNFKTQKKYDLVFSYGFIEHFEDTKKVINKHWDLVNPRGKMIIIFPNLLGLNGIFQLLFDPENMSIHNLMCMDINRLKEILFKLKIKKAEVNYYGGLGVWLEQLDKRNIFMKFLIYGLGGIGKLIKLTGFNSKFISPHIVIVAEKCI
jgi:SAM-dependent methyltransferase